MAANLILALRDNLIFAGNIAKVALGLGFVIFLHELGHFLLAKWNGVKVEKFSIGFGPTLASFRRGVGLRVGTGSRAPGPGDPPSWGETEYILAALPLGGYVKMLGETNEETPEEAKLTDPRAYHNKSVWARMQIITAGVIMNVLLGLVCFAFVFSQGSLERPARVGGVLPGSPAYKAGLRAGDEIVAIDGRRDVGFGHLMARVSLSAAGKPIRFTIKSPGSEGERDLEIEPRRAEDANVPTIGIYPSASLLLYPKTPFVAPPGMTADKARPTLGFEGDDKVVAVGPEGGAMEPVADHAEFLRKTEPLRGGPLVVEVERKGKAERAKVTVPPHHFVDFGLTMTPGPIVAVREGSPASKAGLREGDRVVSVDGDANYDPTGLPDRARSAAGKPLKLTLAREGSAQPVEVEVTPDASPIWIDAADPSGRGAPLDVPGLGLAMAVEPLVRAVAEGSPAAKAGIKPGARVASVTVTPAKPEGSKSTPKPAVLKLDGKASSWPSVFALIQEYPWSSIALTLEKAEKPLAMNPAEVGDRFHPSRGLEFQTLTRKMPPLALGESFRRGLEETYENVEAIFTIFQRLGQGRVDSNALGGAIPIAQIAYMSASTGIAPFVHFLGILSINLAVLNFLPIPPLDGGQFAFLAAEKVRGKPLPDAALNVVTVAGIVFVLGLMLFINGRDIFHLVQSYF